MLGGAIFTSIFFGLRLKPTWAGYVLGFIITPLIIKTVVQLISFFRAANILRKVWGQDFVLLPLYGDLIEAIIVFGAFIGLSSILAVLWQRTHYPEVETNFSKNDISRITWPTVKAASSWGIGAFTGAIVAVIGVGLLVVAYATGLAWYVIGYLLGEMSLRFNAQNTQLLVFFTIVIVGVISGAIGGAVGVRFLWQRTWRDMLFGGIGGAISGVLISTIGIAAMTVLFWWD